MICSHGRPEFRKNAQADTKSPDFLMILIISIKSSQSPQNAGIFHSQYPCLRTCDTVNGANSSAIIYSIAETAKANNLKPFDYFEYLLTEIPKRVDDKNTDFLAELLPWSDMLPENIRKPQKASGK
jgi:hypothetical protein